MPLFQLYCISLFSVFHEMANHFEIPLHYREKNHSNSDLQTHPQGTCMANLSLSGFFFSLVSCFHLNNLLIKAFQIIRLIPHNWVLLHVFCACVTFLKSQQRKSEEHTVPVPLGLPFCFRSFHLNFKRLLFYLDTV